MASIPSETTSLKSCPTSAASDATPTVRRPLRLSKLVVRLFYVLVAIAGGVVIYDLVVSKAELHVVVWGVSALFVGIAIPLSIYDINSHLANYSSPLQLHYIRILLMVPIFAGESWLALRYKEQHTVLVCFRTAYEAIVIYSFFRLMVDFFGGERRVLAALAGKGTKYAHMIPPLCYFRVLRVDLESRGQFLLWTRRGVFQYVVLQPLVAAVNFFAELGGRLCDGQLLALQCVFPYTSVLILGSQLLAMYSLILFYHELQLELAPLRPLPKLLLVKAVVFLSFWQGVLVAGLESVGVIQASETYSTKEIADSIQNASICFEMMVYALLHHYYFSNMDFKGELGALMPRMGEVEGKGYLAGLKAFFLPVDLGVETHDLLLKSNLGDKWLAEEGGEEEGLDKALEETAGT